MKKTTLLAASIALALAGCGGSDNNDNPTAKSFSVTAIDGYLVNANVYAGENCQTKVATTGKGGIARIDGQYQGQTLCVKAVADKTMDESRGLVKKNFELKAPASKDANSQVISPLTDLVVKHMDANQGVSKADAEKAVSAQFAELKAEPELLFGDYLAKSSANKVAQALNIVGETLVSHQGLAEAHLQRLVEDVAAKVEAGDKLDDYEPVITPEGGVESNHRPHIALSQTELDKLTQIEVELGQPMTAVDLSAAFADKDNDSFTLSLMEEDGNIALETLGLAFDAKTGVLSGTPKVAGEIELHAYATDSKGARSYPLEIEIEVSSINHAPVINPAEKAELEAELARMALTVGNQIDQVIDLDELFGDQDKDQLTFSAMTDMQGTALKIEQGDSLRLSGKPLVAGDFVITVTVNDGKHAAVKTDLKVKVADNGVEPEPKHPLEGKTWFTTEWGSADENDDGVMQVWCDTLEFKNGSVLRNVRTQDNLSECSATATVEVSTYIINELGQMVLEYGDDEGVEHQETIKLNDAIAGVGDNAKVLQLWDGRYTLFSKADDVEKRLDIESDDDAQGRMFTAELPAATEASYQLGHLTMQMTAADNRGAKVGLYFDVPNTDFSCDEVREFYDLNLSYEGMEYRIPAYLFPGEENSIEYCQAQFDIEQPVVGKIYSVIGHVTEEDAGLVEEIKANIQWTGTGNNE
ncbi:putative Ig domain-containing protein [Shewanella algae]|uniref:putative Ig domain-containing protein n=1 Tax=Shewanella algae TaxID=38313 RepID=UPI001AAF4C09|nr:putative Ig domain-containing protein [Shewanella algae]EKT4488564.1 hypothetical protein [Shewanella algae]MBO2548295.1 hypothetical protein [Shewanella algae]